MRICYFSDLHLEYYDFDVNFPEAGTLVLAGDICHAADLVQWRKNPERCERRDHALWFFDEILERFDNIVYCVGNHEHFGFDFHETIQALQHAIPDEIHLLDKNAVKIDNILFYGATFWTDFDNANPANIANACEKMPEFKFVYADQGLLKPDVIMEDHRQALCNLSCLSEQNPTTPIVVVTHHSPSFLGLNEALRNPSLDSAFASDQHNFIEQHSNIKHWIFGHTHVQKTFKIAQCQVSANCRGYKDLEAIAHNFNPDIGFCFSAHGKAVT